MPFEPSLLPILFLVVGFASVALGARWRSELALEPRGWLTVDGTIVDVRPATGGHEGYFPVVGYVVPDGRRLRVHGAVSTDHGCGQPGQVVQVFVDPSDPRQARHRRCAPCCEVDCFGFHRRRRGAAGDRHGLGACAPLTWGH